MTTYTIRTTIDPAPFTLKAASYEWGYDFVTFMDKAGNELASFAPGVVAYVLVSK